jgi:hypothetical protein
MVLRLDEHGVDMNRLHHDMFQHRGGITKMSAEEIEERDEEIHQQAVARGKLGGAKIGRMYSEAAAAVKKAIPLVCQSIVWMYMPTNIKVFLRRPQK